MEKESDDILGKRVVRLDLKWSNWHGGMGPVSQLFLIFDDGTNYEFYTALGYVEPGSYTPAGKQPAKDPRLAEYTLAYSARLVQDGEITRYNESKHKGAKV